MEDKAKPPLEKEGDDDVSSQSARVGVGDGGSTTTGAGDGGPGSAAPRNSTSINNLKGSSQDDDSSSNKRKSPPVGAYSYLYRGGGSLNQQSKGYSRETAIAGGSGDAGAGTTNTTNGNGGASAAHSTARGDPGGADTTTPGTGGGSAPHSISNKLNKGPLHNAAIAESTSTTNRTATSGTRTSTIADAVASGNIGLGRKSTTNRIRATQAGAVAVSHDKNETDAAIAESTSTTNRRGAGTTTTQQQQSKQQHGGAQGGGGGEKAPAFLRYLDDDTPEAASMSRIEYDPTIATLADGIEPLPSNAEAKAQQDSQQQRGPGAHSIRGGGGSVINPVIEEEEQEEGEQSTFGIGGGGGGGGEQEEEQQQLPLPDLEEASRCDLVEALPVSTCFFDYSSSKRVLAQPVDYNDQGIASSADQQQRRRRKYKQYKILGCCLVIAALLVLILTLSIGLTGGSAGDHGSNDAGKEDESTFTTIMGNNGTPTTPGPSTTTSSLPPPPMGNLEDLYLNLPDKTKRSLYNSDSSQYQAWEWLLNHPNVTTYPEWRKKQVFAMATFFISLEGLNWPEGTPGKNRWMNSSISECDWVLTDPEITYFAHFSAAVLGHVYSVADFQPCNPDGKLQTIIMHKVYLPANNANARKPSFPPEIGLLTSLKLLGIMISQIHTKLSELLVPELIELPNLSGLNLQSSGVSGTIPTSIGLLTGIRHLPLGSNQFMGTIPTEIGTMTNLEFFTVSQSKELTGKLPTQLGLVTSLTALYTYGSFLTGQIPSEFGLLTNAILLEVWNNALTGRIPTELGLMTNIVDLRLGNDLGVQSFFLNDFTGTLPNELWELSHLEELSLSNLPNLHGRIPSDIMMPNLTMFSISGSPQLSGAIPEGLCSVPELNIDCSTLLCGCYCPCISSNIINQTNP